VGRIFIGRLFIWSMVMWFIIMTETVKSVKSLYPRFGVDEQNMRINKIN